MIMAEKEAKEKGGNINYVVRTLELMHPNPAAGNSSSYFLDCIFWTIFINCKISLDS